MISQKRDGLSKQLLSNKYDSIKLFMILQQCFWLSNAVKVQIPL